MQIRPSNQTHIPSHHGAAGRQPVDQKPDMPRVHDGMHAGKVRPHDGDMTMHRGQVRDGGRSIQAPQGEHEMPNNGEVRKHLASIDRSMRKRVMAMGQEHGLDAADSRALAKEFHKGIKTAFEAFKAGDIPDKQALMLEVRQAFQTMKEGLHSQMAAANETSGANTTPTLTSTSGSAVTAAGNVVATATPGPTIQDPVAPPVASGGSTAGTGAVGNVVATQTTAAGSTAPSTAPTPFNTPDLIVDPTVGGPEDIAAAAAATGTGVTDALASLIERFEAAVEQLGELFEGGGVRDHDGGHQTYDAGGMRDLEVLIGRRFDALA